MKIEIKEAQARAIEQLAASHNVFLWGEMGTGKTLMAIEALKSIQGNNIRRKTCWVVAPKSTIVVTWSKHLNLLYPEAEHAIIGTSSDAHLQRAYVVLMTPGLLHSRIDDLIKTTNPPEVIIWDELTTLSGRGAHFKAAMRLKRKFKPAYLWGMTGTPMADDPLGLYGQAAFISAKVPFIPFYTWRGATMYQVSQYKWVPHSHWMDTIKAWLPDNIYVKTEDVYDQSATHYNPIYQEQPKAMAELQQRLIAQQMLHIGGLPIVPSNTAHLCSMLLQLSAGFVYRSEGNPIAVSDHRIEAVVNYCKSLKHKVIIFAPYTYMINRLADRLTACKIDGGVVKDRHEVLNKFRQSSQQFLVANPAAMAHGVTLTEATETVWAAPCYSNQQFQQANARIQRLGQHNPVTYSLFYSSKFEVGVYDVLRNKGNLQEYFMNYIGNHNGSIGNKPRHSKNVPEFGPINRVKT